MNIIEAVKSGRDLRPKGSTLPFRDAAAYFRNRNPGVLVDEILGEFEIEEPKVEVTASQVRVAIVCEVRRMEDLPSSFRPGLEAFLDGVCRELGLEE